MTESAAAVAAWPPQSLSYHTADIINECESMEISGAPVPEGMQFVSAVHMAALLYSGEFVHARHLWRRSSQQVASSEDSSSQKKPSPDDEALLLADWWKVGQAWMNRNGPELWAALGQVQSTHPAPLNHYAVQVGTSIRRRLYQEHPLVQPYLQLWNVASAEEALAIVQSEGFLLEGEDSSKNSSSIDTVVAFLERQTAAKALAAPSATAAVSSSS